MAPSASDGVRMGAAAMTTYTVTAERGADPSVWVLQCVEHPGAVSQTRDLADAPELMREAIAWVAGVDEGDVEVEVVRG